MSGVFFKTFGVVCFLLAAVVVSEYVNIVLMQVFEPKYFVGQTVRGGSVLLLLTAVGVGLFYSRKWAAVLGSIFFAYISIRLFYDATNLTGGRIWIIVSLSIVSMLPLLGSIKFWRSLKSGGRWYF